MNIYARYGNKVRFVEENVSNAQINWGGNNDPRGLLVVGQIYTIDHTEVHSQHTKVFLVEHPFYRFNSIWFEDVEND